MLLRWLVVSFVAFHLITAEETFYDYLISKNASQELTDFCKELSEIEGGYQKSMEMGFVPSFEEFSRTSYAIFAEYFILDKPDQHIAYDMLEKMKIFNMTVIEKEGNNLTNWDHHHFVKCALADFKCNPFVRGAFKKYDIFNNTEKCLKHVKTKYPAVAVDLEEFIEQGKKNYEFLKNENEKAVFFKITELMVYALDDPYYSAKELLKTLTKDERADVWYNIFWFTRRIDRLLYDNMLKLKWAKLSD